MIVTALMACRLARGSGRRRISKSNRPAGASIHSLEPDCGSRRMEEGDGRWCPPSRLPSVERHAQLQQAMRRRYDAEILIALRYRAVAYTRRRPHNQHFDGSTETLMPTRATLYKSMNSDSKIEIPVCSGNGSPLVSYGKETSCYRSLG